MHTFTLPSPLQNDFPPISVEIRLCGDMSIAICLYYKASMEVQSGGPLLMQVSCHYYQHLRR